jgi:hypothetical protein
MAIKMPQFLRTVLGIYRGAYSAITLQPNVSNKGLSLPKTDAGWQGKGWQYYDVTPEVRQVVYHRSRAVSKVVINIAMYDENRQIEIVDEPATRALLEWLFGGRQNHGQNMGLLAQHRTIVGESVLIIAENQPTPAGATETLWWTLAPDQVDTSHMSGPAGYIEAKSPTDGQPRRFPTDGPNPVRVIRSWKKHPHQQWEADSPIRGGIATLDTIAHLTASIKSAALSRLIGGGLYPIPLEAQLPQPTANDKAGITAYDKFRQDLYDAASTAIQNPGSAAAQMPIFLHIPAEAIKAMLEKPIDFSTKFDERAGELLDMAIRRFAQGQPMPTEKMAGDGAGNHWTAWQISEEDLQMDIGPLTEEILADLTKEILHPLMGRNDLFFHPDYTSLVTRPDRTPEAMELYIAGVITIEEARDMSGFPEQFDGHLKDTLQVSSQRLPSDTATAKGLDTVDAEITKPQIDTTKIRPEIPQRQTARDGKTAFTALVTDHLLVTELLRETGKKMLTSAPRAARGAMMEIPEEERHLHFDGAFAAFQHVVPKVVSRYTNVLDEPQIQAGVGAAQLAITERPMGND